MLSCSYTDWKCLFSAMKVTSKVMEVAAQTTFLSVDSDIVFASKNKKKLIQFINKFCKERTSDLLIWLCSVASIRNLDRDSFNALFVYELDEYYNDTWIFLWNDWHGFSQSEGSIQVPFSLLIMAWLPLIAKRFDLYITHYFSF